MIPKGMASRGPFDEEFTTPRVVEALFPLPNYLRGSATRMDGCVRTDAAVQTDVGPLRFEIYQARESHGTSARIHGFGSEAIDILGLPILLAGKKVLLEIWNDSELNCWCEYDLDTKTDVFLRRGELEAYLARYIQDTVVKEAYLRDVQRFYGTEALNYCHYYFESDKVEDRRVLLEGCATIEPLERRWSAVKQIAEGHLDRNERQSTWRGLCVLWLANEVFFKGSDIEPKLLAEYCLLGDTALSWGGQSQRRLIRRARRYLPFVTRLFEKTTEADRGREVWAVAYYQMLTGLIFRVFYRQGSEQVENLKWLMKKMKDGEAADQRIAGLFLEGLPSTGLLSRQEKTVLRGGD